MNTEDRTYDHIGEFHQGIAIVEKGGKYGAIMIGGKEIISPIYEALSDFNNGLATAKFNGEERTINMLGQILVRKEGNEIFLPEEYDWGYNLVGKLFVVVKNCKYGIIDEELNVVIECVYTYFGGNKNGHIILGTYYGFLQSGKNKPQLIVNEATADFYSIISSFPNGDNMISIGGETDKMVGIMNEEMKFIIPLSHWQIQRLNNGYYVVDSEDNVKQIINPDNGDIIFEKVVDEIEGLNNDFFVTYYTNEDICETCIYKEKTKVLLLSIPYKVHVSLLDGDSVTFYLNDLEYKCDLEGKLFLISKRVEYGFYRNYRWEKITEREVSHEHVLYEHISLTNDYEIIVDDKYLKGISDSSGNVIIEPKYSFINYLFDDLFITAIPNLEEERKTLVFGVIDIFNNVKIPFDYKYLCPIGVNYIAYTNDKIYEVTHNNNYHCLEISSTGYYKDIKFGIIDICNNIVSPPSFYKIQVVNYGSAFIVGNDSMNRYGILQYGIIDSNGATILKPQYKEIKYDEKKQSFSVTLSYREADTYSLKEVSNEISIDGFFLVRNVDGDIIKMPTTKADWCGNFSKEGVADVVRGGIKGFLNLQNQIVCFTGKYWVPIPEIYDFASICKYGYIPILKNEKYGIIDSSFKEVIPCCFEYIEALSTSTFKFKEIDKWGVVDKHMNIIIAPEYINICNETENIFLIEIKKQNGSITESRYGLLDKKGNTILPINCRSLTKIESSDNKLWIVDVDEGCVKYKKGVYCEHNGWIIPAIYDNIELKDDEFLCSIYEKESYYSYSNDRRSIKFTNVYNFKGEQRLSIDENLTLDIPNEYDIAYYGGLRNIRVMKNCKWGLINMTNDIVIEPQFDYISTFEHSFAIVGQAENIEDTPVEYFLDNRDYYSKMKYGLVDTFGEIVLPVEYDYIRRLDNDYFLVQCKGNKLLSPSLNVVVELNYGIWGVLDNRFFIVSGESTYSRQKYNLIDFFGNEIVKGFEKIEVIEENLLKATFFRSDLDGASHIGILNNQGKVLYESRDCDDISYVGNGLLCVKSFEYTNSDGAGFYAYNLANLQGKELFDRYYKNIEFQDTGDIFVEAAGRKSWDTTWGMANAKGELIIAPKYKDKLIFEDGFSEIRVKGCESIRRINKKGNVVVSDSEGGTVLIPKEFYWASNFVKGCSLVRSKDGDYIGVINKSSETIIKATFDEISMFSNGMIIAKESNVYGLYNLSGECVFPTIFTAMKYIGANRLRVAWNISYAVSWERGSFVPGERNYVSSSQFDENSRSALCDSNGNVLNSEDFVYVGKNNGRYALAFGGIEKCDSKYVDFSAKLTQAGVIDIDGNTIIPPGYDKIRLYDEHDFVLLEKDSIFGIADLNTKSIRMFNDVDMKHVRDVDAYGKAIYTNNGVREWNEEDEREYWTGDEGVLSLNGIVVPAGQYQRITLLENGLIKVSNDGLFGLLDSFGKELLPLKYSYISSFIGNYASICLGGYDKVKGGDDYYSYRYSVHVGGKWGIIDNNGHFFKECVSEERLELPEFVDEKVDRVDSSEIECPHILLSDQKPPFEVEFYDSSSYYNHDYYDDGCSKYGGYNGYDDDTIDSAFEGDPELTWNID